MLSDNAGIIESIWSGKKRSYMVTIQEYVRDAGTTFLIDFIEKGARERNVPTSTGTTSIQSRAARMKKKQMPDYYIGIRYMHLQPSETRICYFVTVLISAIKVFNVISYEIFNFR